MTVDRTTFVVSHKSQLFQHFLLYANGYAFNCHKITTVRYIVCLFYIYHVV
nr:MAG TPA: hypothetical protein [Caudoviricetes sp.]